MGTTGGKGTQRGANKRNWGKMRPKRQQSLLGKARLSAVMERFYEKRDGCLGRRESERGSEGLWYSEERDDRLACRRDPGIAREALGKREPVMRPLCTRKNQRRWGSTDFMVVVMPDVHSLGAQKLDASPSIPPATPITPQQRSRANRQRMQ